MVEYSGTDTEDGGIFRHGHGGWWNIQARTRRMVEYSGTDTEDGGIFRHGHGGWWNIQARTRRMVEYSDMDTEDGGIFRHGHGGWWNIQTWTQRVVEYSGTDTRPIQSNYAFYNKKDHSTPPTFQDVIVPRNAHRFSSHNKRDRHFYGLNDPR